MTLAATVSRVRRRATHVAFGAMLVATSVGVGVANVSAQEAVQGRTTLLQVDTTELNRGYMVVESTGVDSSADDVVVKEAGGDVNDLDVKAIPVPNDRNIVALVLDTTAVMANGDQLDKIKAGAIDTVNSLPDDTRFLVASFGTQAALTIAQPTSDKQVVIANIEGFEVGSSSNQAAALRNVVRALEVEGATSAQVLLVSAGQAEPTDAAGTERDEAVRGLKKYGAVVHSIGVAGGSDYADADGGKIVKYFATQTGGTFTEVTDVATLEDTVAAKADVLRREAYEATWRSDLNVFPVDDAGNVVGDPSDQSPFLLTVSLGELTSNAVINHGTRTLAPPESSTLPEAPTTLGLPSGTARILMLVFGGIGIALLIFAFALLAQRENVDLLNRMSTMQEWAAAQVDGGDGPSAAAGIKSLGNSTLVKAAVKKTTTIASQRGILSGVESKLEQAALNLRAGEAIFFVFAGAVSSFLVGFLFFGPVPALVLGGLAVMLPQAILNQKAAKRLKAFNSGLPDMLNLLSSSLRAGYSVMQALDAVATEVSDPMGQELRRVVSESQLGRPVNDAMMDVAYRMKSPDFEWAVMAINIQREVGGNLSELLDTVASTMIERERLRREIRALTAEGRASAYMLGFMPGALLIVMYTMNKEYISTLFNTGTGQAMLGLAALAQVVGMLWMRKIVSIKL